LLFICPAELWFFLFLLKSAEPFVIWVWILAFFDGFFEALLG
jgi:hypothetical protein